MMYKIYIDNKHTDDLCLNLIITKIIITDKYLQTRLNEQVTDKDLKPFLMHICISSVLSETTILIIIHETTIKITAEEKHGNR